MKMVIGGAHQGKTEYAKHKYPDVVFVDGAICEFHDLFTCSGMYHFEEYLRRFLKETEQEKQNLSEKIIEENPNLVLVSNEIGYGLVPIDDFERMYREFTGRVCTELAAFSEQVDRVVCGIGMRIK